MARYFSVEEISEVLDTTERTVRRMLNDGRLAGSQKMEKGKLVWRVHATKDILSKVDEFNRLLNTSTETVDVEAEAETIEVEEETSEDEIEESKSNWREEGKNKATTAVDDFWEQVSGKFLERLETKDQIIGEMKFELAEKDRQLKLIPDMQKQAEEDRLLAEEKALESIALQKQIAAMREEKDNLDQQLLKVESDVLPKLERELEAEREEKIRDLAILEDRVKHIDKKLKAAKQFEDQVSDLKEELELKSESEKRTKKELEQMKAEKENLEAELAKHNIAWWKKWFLPQDNKQS